MPESLPDSVTGRDEIIAGIEQGRLLKRAATFSDVGNVAAFVASDQARTMTAATVNISCGAIMDYQVRRTDRAVMKNLERHRQRLEAAQVGCRIPTQLLRRTSQAQIWQALQQRANGNLTFQACQWGPQTIMDACAKGQVSIDLARDVERFWISKLLRICIGSGQGDPQQIALANYLCSLYTFQVWMCSSLWDAVPLVGVTTCCRDPYKSLTTFGRMACGQSSARKPGGCGPRR